MTQHGGPHLLQTPGPSTVPDRVLRAIATPTIDHRGPDFADLTLGLLNKLQLVFRTDQPVIVYPSSGTGAWEAALSNCLAADDRILAFETGHFATLWKEMAERLGHSVEFVPGDWRHGVDPEVVEQRLAADAGHEIAAVCVVHNETSTGVCSRVAEIRQAIDRTGHPALLLVDTISSLGSIDYRHDEWGVDVTVGGSQKGLMLPPGLGFNVASEKALAAAARAAGRRSYWSWQPIIEANRTGYFPYTPATNMLFGLDEATDMLLEEGLDAVFTRHTRYGDTVRSAVRAWGLEIVCLDEREYSNSVTGIQLPEGHDSFAIRAHILDRFNMSLGTGFGAEAKRVFRIGHLGYLNDLTLIGVLAGVQLGMAESGVRVNDGVAAAMSCLSPTAPVLGKVGEPAAW